jgi:hypothetical protein
VRPSRQDWPAFPDSRRLHGECFLCGGRFPYSLGQYRGRAIPAWDIVVCDVCYSMNHDGLVPHFHRPLFEHLAARNIVPRYNDRGFLLWPAE